MDWSMYEPEPEKDPEQCPVCGCFMSDEEYKKNKGVCYECGDKLKRGY